MIIRVEKTKNYSVIANYHLEDNRLSLKAKGLLTYFLSRPDYWKIYVEQVEKTTIDGKKAITNAMDELIKAGYMIKTKQRYNGRQKRNDYTIFEKSQIPECQKGTLTNTELLICQKQNQKNRMPKGESEKGSQYFPVQNCTQTLDNKGFDDFKAEKTRIPFSESQKGTLTNTDLTKNLTKKILTTTNTEPANVVPIQSEKKEISDRPAEKKSSSSFSSLNSILKNKFGLDIDNPPEFKKPVPIQDYIKQNGDLTKIINLNSSKEKRVYKEKNIKQNDNLEHNVNLNSSEEKRVYKEKNIKQNDNLEHNVNLDSVQILLNLIPKKYNIKLTAEVIKKAVSQYSSDYIKTSILYTNAHIKSSSEVRQYKAYLAKCLEANWAAGYEEIYEAAAGNSNMNELQDGRLQDGGADEDARLKVLRTLSDAYLQEEAEWNHCRKAGQVLIERGYQEYVSELLDGTLELRYKKIEQPKEEDLIYEM